MAVPSDDLAPTAPLRHEDDFTHYFNATQRLSRELNETRSLLIEALDEIYALRTICAYEEGVVKTYTEYKSFPKSRRRVADDQMARLRAAVTGEAQRVSNYEIPFTRWVREKVGLLTLEMWKDEVARRNPPRRGRDDA